MGGGGTVDQRLWAATMWRMLGAAILLLGLQHPPANAAAGTEQYRYDALGRLTRVTFPDGKTIEYVYDAAGNRRTVGPAPGGPPGTFTKTGGYSPSGAGSGSITIQNTGSGTITNVVVSLANIGAGGCSGGPTSYGSLAPGQSITFGWYRATSGTIYCTPKATGVNATNSPIQWAM
jgi:YD repeat-containing protein